MKKETQSRIAQAVIGYVEAQTGDTEALLSELGPEADPVHPDAWISAERLCRLLSRARSLLDDPLTPTHAARFAMESASVGRFRRAWISAFRTMGPMIKRQCKRNDRADRSKRTELVHLERDAALIRLHWHPSAVVTRDLCLFYQGIFAYMPLAWGGHPLSLLEHSCAVNGAACCEYHLAWTAEAPMHERLRRIFVPGSALRKAVSEMEQENRASAHKFETVFEENRTLTLKVARLTEIQEIGKAILSVLDLDELPSAVMGLLEATFGIRHGLLLQVDEEHQRLKCLVAAGFGDSVPKAIRDLNLPLSRISNRLVRAVNSGRPAFIPDVHDDTKSGDSDPLFQMPSGSAFVVPLITRSKIIGVIAVDGAVSADTRETIESLAPQIAIAIGNARLHRELRHQMEDLRQSSVLLSRMERYQFLGSLASRLAHEIKNPMTAIGTFFQMLPQKYDDAEFRNDFQKIALEETDRVNSLITELLDLVNTRASCFEPVDFNALIRKMLVMISLQGNTKRIRIDADLSKEIGDVVLDSEKIKQVISNLASNAIDACDYHGRIEVRTRPILRQNRPAVRFEIRDNGPGIPADIVDKVFDPYFTTKHKSSIHRGTGLGLFIAHQHVLDHNGTIEVDRSYANGTGVVVILPLDTGKLTETDGNHAACHASTE